MKAYIVRVLLGILACVFYSVCIGYFSIFVFSAVFRDFNFVQLLFGSFISLLFSVPFGLIVGLIISIPYAWYVRHFSLSILFVHFFKYVVLFSVLCTPIFLLMIDVVENNVLEVLTVGSLLSASVGFCIGAYRLGIEHTEASK